MHTRTLLVDGDIVAYKVASAEEKPIRWGDGLWTLHADENDAQASVDYMFHDYGDKLEADHIVIAFSGSENFRYSIYPDYKANRKNKRKPMLLEPLKDYMKSNYSTFTRPQLEADDVLGIFATSEKIFPSQEKIILTIDKDLKQIPGLFVNMDDPELRVQRITKEDGIYQHMLQTLTGDRVDNYPGCPGIGPVGACKVLNSVLDGIEGESYHQAMWRAVLKAYEKKKLSPEIALQQAQIAKICTANDYNFHTHKPILWMEP